MAFKLIEAETIPLTRELVDSFVNMEPSPTERETDPSRIAYLKAQAEAGQLVTFNWSQAVLEGKKVRMNGQHSSTMLKELNGSFPEGLVVHLDTYQVDKKSDLAQLFRQFDARKSARSPKDIAGAFQGLHDDLKETPRAAAKLAVEGIAWYERAIEGSRTTLGDEQYMLFDDQRWHPFIRWMGDLLDAKTPELRSPSIVAAIYATWGVNPDAAQVFWTQVYRGGVEFEDNAPATVLDAWLKDAISPDIRRRQQLKPTNLYQGCIYAWNAFREERSLKDIKSRIDKGVLPLVH